MKKEILAGKEYIVENGLYYPVNKEYNVEVLVPDIEFEDIDNSKLNSIGRARLKYLQDYDKDKYLVL